MTGTSSFITCQAVKQHWNVRLAVSKKNKTKKKPFFAIKLVGDLCFFAMS